MTERASEPLATLDDQIEKAMGEWKNPGFALAIGPLGRFERFVDKED